MVDKGRDLDIGIPTTRNLTRPVEVQNFAGVITSVDNVASTVASKVDETNLELKKIKTGISLDIEVDLDELLS
ncbi:hypothetical protein LCGC14_0477260 [marine sediment metagenome]|uniref:Uncharacterized protein n=1 Tax=marine sediment metagenome TaxID=412755 RepID=A0A0F9SFT6_9ZZZZ